VSALDRLWYGRAPAWQRALAAVVLGPASLVYGGVIAVRHALFDVGLLRVHRVEGLQVVSVGNVVVGGSGKTPLVIFLAQWALAAGHRVAVLSRGYGRNDREPLDFDASVLPETDRCGDEPRLIARRAPGARLFVEADRVSAAHRARASGCTVALLDDGFQHRRLARDADVLIEIPEASTAALPWGPGREFSSGKRRATVVWNGRGATDPTGRLVVTAVRSTDGSLLTLTAQPVVALSGIARPERFTDTLVGLGAHVVGVERFSDHHRFSTRDLERVRANADRAQALIVTTEKDRERLPAGFEAVVVETVLEVTSGLETLARAVGWPSACAPVPSMERVAL
jgi:tetraacyldisaccharide 4'-kinase